MKSYIERIMEEHPNWPRRVRNGEYVGVLSGVQPLGGGEAAPIYRFPGGESLAVGAPAVRTLPTEERGVLKCGCCGGELLCDMCGNMPDLCPSCHEGVDPRNSIKTNADECTAAPQYKKDVEREIRSALEEDMKHIVWNYIVSDSRYKYGFFDTGNPDDTEILVIRDLSANGPYRTITNGMLKVMREIEADAGRSLTGTPIIYTDSLGCCDGIAYRPGDARAYSFGSIDCDENTALDTVLLRPDMWQLEEGIE